MKYHGFGVLLDDLYDGPCLRRILLFSVLATDMSVHQDFMLRFKRMLDGESTSLCARQTLICEAILKNADISNPVRSFKFISDQKLLTRLNIQTRPFMVSKHWANALMREWTAQALLEQEYHLKQSVMSSDDPLKEAESQIIFISLFAKPLLELTVRAAPNLSMYYHHCKANLQSWHQRKAILYNQYGGGGTTQKSLPTPPPPPSAVSSPCPPPVCQYHSAFPLALPNYQPKLDNSSRTTFTCRSSDHDSRPQSPSCESESVSSSAMLSPISDISCSYHSSTASTSSCNTTQSHIPSSHAAIRAASKSGGLKLQAQRNKKGSRNSWGSSATSAPGGMGVTTFSQQQQPPLTPPPFTLTPTTISASHIKHCYT